jgi:hypothetical protein
MSVIRSALCTAALLALGAAHGSAVDISEATFQGRPHLTVRTERATWLYDRSGGGFSRLVDREGRDWIGFGVEPLSQFPDSAAAGYRGLGNLVFVGPDKGAGHPGFDLCTTEILGPATIRTASRSGRWAWSWVFTETTATFTMEKADPDHPWWFLYEGPVAGTFAPGQKVWGTDRGGPRSDVPAIGSQLFDRWRWVYFGDREVRRVLFLAQHEPDDLPDTLWYLGSSEGGAATAPAGMVVFGFGRGPETTPRFRGAGVRVTVGLLETSPAEHRAISALVTAAVAGEPEGPDPDRTIRVWYGPEQRFGHLGEPQRWVNVLGNVGGAGSLETLAFELNDQEVRPLSVGTDLHRLAVAGDFNVELGWDELRPGPNRLRILARWNDGATASTIIRLVVERGLAWPLPYRVDLSRVRDLQNAVQVVDGEWRLTSDGVRTVTRWYDRVLAVGDDSWTDYEATILLTLHGFTPAQGGPPTYGVPHVGIGLRWPGHSADGLQPSRQWHPIGAATEFLIQPDGRSGRWRILADGGAHFAEVRAPEILPLAPGRFRLKAQVTTLPDGRSRYRVKQWNDGAPEPAGWAVEGREDAGEDVTTGSLLVVPHNTDVTVHEIQVVPVGPGPAPEER